MPDINPEDYEVICNVCDLRSFRDLCVTEYQSYLATSHDEEFALSRAVALAYELNASSE